MESSKLPPSNGVSLGPCNETVLGWLSMHEYPKGAGERAPTEGRNSHRPRTHPKEGLPRKQVGFVWHKRYTSIFWFCSDSLLILLRAPTKLTS